MVGRVIKILTGAILVVVAVYVGARVAFYFTNLSLVFYRSGRDVTIHSPAQSSEPYPLLNETPVKNVILFIGDGMGLSQLAAARIHFVGAGGRLNIERMPVTGLLTTHSVDDLVTDSAASATSLATGIKTRNGMVGVDSSGAPHLTILEAARDVGMSTGLVTSTDLTDATPAAFATHVARRKFQDEIALQLINSHANVLLGEGRHFYPKSDSRSKRKDDLNPLVMATESGYRVVHTKDDLEVADDELLLGVFDDIVTDRWEREIKPDPDSPSLSEMTHRALELLSRNERGFFLMVEEEGVDKGGHANREDYFLHYLKEFDEAVKVGLEFALRDKQTLVLVTADHETGGVELVNGSHKKRSPSFKQKYFEMSWATDGHTGQPVPLFAFGPFAIRFTGLKDNTEIPKILAELLELKALLR